MDNNEYKCNSIDDVIFEVKTYIKEENPIQLILKAYKYAEEQHKGQFRKNGDDYIIHPIWTAYFLAKLKMGPLTIIAGLLHDVLEDTPVTEEDLKKIFGEEVAKLVESVTKVSYFAKENRNQIKAMYLRKLYLSMARDIRVIIIKLADRLHNMLTIKNLNLEKQHEIAKETIEIYSPIAHRLGMKMVKTELEDLSFEVLDPKAFNKVIRLLEIGKTDREKIVETKKTELKKLLLDDKQIPVTIFGRSKSVYSIYRKMNLFGKDFDDIHDILAIRILTSTIDQCYQVLGYIHQNYTPLAGRFKDYIATPKNNLYQSLHTTIVGENGYIFEIQIRTYEMDEIAEQGAAAHWRYKEGEKYDISKKQKDIDDRLDIFNHILDLENMLIADSSNEKEGETSSNQHFIEEIIQKDIFSSLIYILTPNGKVITLPFGSTVLDFAYKIHSELGEKTTGAKINGVFSPLATILKSGNIVEIKTSNNQKPNHSWLLIAKTTSALQKIKRYLKKEIQEQSAESVKQTNYEKIKAVKQRIKDYIEKNNLKWNTLDYQQTILKLKDLNYNTIEDFLLEVANNEYSIEEACKLAYLEVNISENEKLLNRLKDKKYSKSQLKDDIIVENVTGIKASISQCCYPVPYEPITGFISKLEGIKVHVKTCKNVLTPDKQQRLINAQWNEPVVENKQYDSAIRIEAFDRPAILVDITKILNHLNSPIQSINAKNNGESFITRIDLIIKVNTYDKLMQIISSLKATPDVKVVERTVY